MQENCLPVDTRTLFHTPRVLLVYLHTVQVRYVTIGKHAETNVLQLFVAAAQAEIHHLLM